MISILIGGVSLTPSGRPAPTPVAIYTSEACILHDPGMRMGEVLPEQPARLANLIHAMRTQWAGEYGELLQIREPEVDVTKEQLLRVHTEQYLDTLDGFFKRLERPAAGGIRPRVNLDQDTVVAANSQAAATRASGLVCAAVDEIFGGCVYDESSTGGSGERHRAKPGDCVRRAFVMVRPPGHHAEAGKAGGFCIYNNVMIGVAHAQALYGLERVAIIDFDVVSSAHTVERAFGATAHAQSFIFSESVPSALCSTLRLGSDSTMGMETPILHFAMLRAFTCPRMSSAYGHTQQRCLPAMACTVRSYPQIFRRAVARLNFVRRGRTICCRRSTRSSLRRSSSAQDSTLMRMTRWPP